MKSIFVYWYVCVFDISAWYISTQWNIYAPKLIRTKPVMLDIVCRILVLKLASALVKCGLNSGLIIKLYFLALIFERKNTSPKFCGILIISSRIKQYQRTLLRVNHWVSRRNQELFVFWHRETRTSKFWVKQFVEKVEERRWKTLFCLRQCSHLVQ